MYTKCPNCSTIFTATDEDLGAQQGLVRCGRCREVFSASWNLVNSIPGEEQRETATSFVDSGDAADLPTAAGHMPDSTSERPQKWTVSEQSPDLPVAAEEAITETLTITDFATTEEVEHLGDYADASAPRQPPKPDTENESSPGPLETELNVPGDVDEEIVIEAPTNLWNLNDDRELLESGTETTSDVSAGKQGPQELPGEQSGRRAGVKGSVLKPDLRMIALARQADDVKLVEIPHPKPIRSAAWTAAALVLVVAVFWQLKQYYLTELAEIASLREHLETICEYTSCTVPPRTDIKRVDLASTSVDPHPATPGALRVSANLINRATFAQPFPPLEVTLTDTEGAVVGRRTYLPHEYRAGPPGDMSPNVLERVDLDLAQPAQSAVGYEIQLVAR